MSSRICAGFAKTSIVIGVLLFSVAPVSTPKAGLQADRDAAAVFRWIHPESDPQLWGQIQTAFSTELAPDRIEEGKDPLDAYVNKYLQMVCIHGHSALVIIGHRPAPEIYKKNDWDEYSSAFNLELETLHKETITGAQVMWKWKFFELAKLSPSRVPDITFTYLTCTECEPDLMLNSLYYDSTGLGWRVRSWGDGKDFWWIASDGLVVDEDVIVTTDTISFDCIYGTEKQNGNELEGFVIRCKEVTEAETGRGKVEDLTFLYTVSGGQLKRRQITDFSEVARLTTDICRPGSPGLLCKLPPYMTVTAGQNAALKSMFPNAPKTIREIKYFRALKKDMSMADVVHRCGMPDELGGSGIAIFIYHLSDGSLVAIGATGATAPILYATRIGPTGKSTSLLPEK